MKKGRALPRSLIQHRLQRQKRSYERTGNPLYIWESYRLCRQHDLELPDDVLFYLDRVAENLTSMAGDVGEAPRCVLRALGISPKAASPVGKSFEDTDGADKVALVTLIRMHQGLSLEDAVLDVAEHSSVLIGRHVDERTVERCYRKFKELHAGHDREVLELAKKLADSWRWDDLPR